MLAVHVHVQVKPEYIAAFKEASIVNAAASLKEAGIVRFDVLQQEDDSTQFLLVEVYRSLEATSAHKQTTHYQAWRDAVAPMMAQPRSSVKYQPLFPDGTW